MNKATKYRILIKLELDDKIFKIYVPKLEFGW